jgi:universal stress protein E
MQFSNILAYVDERPESEATLLHTAALTRESQNSVVVLDVLEALHDIDSLPDADDLESLRNLLVKSRKEWLQLQATNHQLRTADITVKIGKTSLEIIKQVLVNHHDLVIKTARGKTDGRRITYGSTAMHLLRKCPCPVWLVAPGTKPPPKRILAALNPMGAERTSIAKKILTNAVNLSEHFGAELHVLHSWNPHVEPLIHAKVSNDIVTKHIESTHTFARSSLENLLEDVNVSLLDRQVHLVLGNAVDAIESVAIEQRVDTLVIGSVGQSYHQGQLIGSVAEEVLTRVDCSVFCIKPDGFISPIRLD